MHARLEGGGRQSEAEIRSELKRVPDADTPTLGDVDRAPATERPPRIASDLGVATWITSDGHSRCPFVAAKARTASRALRGVREGHWHLTP